MKRFSIKIGGASGTGINTIGMVFSRAFKRANYYTVAYREYPSLIKGGYASFKIDVSDEPINAAASFSDILVAIDRHSFDIMAKEANNGISIIYDSNLIRPTEEQNTELKMKSVTPYPLPLTIATKEIGGSPIMKNTVLMGAMWKLLGLNEESLINTILDVFNKTKEIEDKNKECAQKGFTLIQSSRPEFILERLSPGSDLSGHISITGNEALAIGAIKAGVRAYFAYPMTPSSTVLSTFAKYAQKYGVVVKQAEDEITAANMTIGANHAGTRAMTGTSGGGFDLMSETISLSGITETPLVIILAQRPGPGTGLPTWTNQGDLRLAINAGHGEFPRIVLAPGDIHECFTLIQDAHNLAEKFQTAVIVLTDKYLAENIYSVDSKDNINVAIDRGELKMTPEKFLERYQITQNGISARWLPGTDANTFTANSDEHQEHGYSTEDLKESKEMLDKRMRKLDTIMSVLPEPEMFGPEDADVSFISWGSTKHILIDAMKELEREGKKINIMNFKYVYPLKTEKLKIFASRAKNLILIENNQTAQLHELINIYTDIKVKDLMLKYDGSPFFVEEIIDKVKTLIK